MKLITDSLTEQLLANGRAQRAAMDKNGRSRFEQTLGWPAGRGPGTGSEYNDQPVLDFKPVVKLFSILRLVGLFEHPALARRRRVRGVTPTRLSASGRCHILVASRRPMYPAPDRLKRQEPF